MTETEKNFQEYDAIASRVQPVLDSLLNQHDPTDVLFIVMAALLPRFDHTEIIDELAQQYEFGAEEADCDVCKLRYARLSEEFNQLLSRMETWDRERDALRGSSLAERNSEAGRN